MANIEEKIIYVDSNDNKGNRIAKKYTLSNQGKYQPFKSNTEDTRNMGFLGFIVILLLIVAVYSALNGSGHVLTFTGFLERISSFTAPFPNLAIANSSILADWGLFNFFRDFLNLFIQLFDFVMFLAKSMTNIAVFVFDIVKFLFGF